MSAMRKLWSDPRFLEAVQKNKTGPERKPDADSKAAPAKELKALDDRRQTLKKARSAWVAVKIKAEEDLEKVKEGARIAYMADAEQFPKVVKGCKEIDDILDNLDDELRDTLDQYVSTPIKNKAKLDDLAGKATGVLDGYLQYVANNPLMKAIDQKEFANVTIHAPVMTALSNLRKALS